MMTDDETDFLIKFFDQTQEGFNLIAHGFKEVNQALEVNNKYIKSLEQIVMNQVQELNQLREYVRYINSRLIAMECKDV